MSGYLEALEAHNEAADPKAKPDKGPPGEWLKRAVKDRVWG